MFFIIGEKNKKVIGVDITKPKEKRGGPAMLINGISKALPYETKYFKFVPLDGIYPSDKKEIDYYYFPYPSMGENTYEEWKNIQRANSLLLGPAFIPANWREFPNNKYWPERKFKEILSTIKGIIVHSERVRDHLIEKSKTQDLINKFIILRP